MSSQGLGVLRNQTLPGTCSPQILQRIVIFEILQNFNILHLSYENYVQINIFSASPSDQTSDRILTSELVHSIIQLYDRVILVDSNLEVEGQKQYNPTVHLWTLSQEEDRPVYRGAAITNVLHSKPPFCKQSCTMLNITFKKLSRKLSKTKFLL